ncbi:MAG: phosphoribosylformylglycinamidine cyclo-ligase [Proteobacteria bacterium]|nr:phosphoribosylformylglycinamidine cyclo-ligase [Pseudomonadota bacterium]
MTSNKTTHRKSDAYLNAGVDDKQSFDLVHWLSAKTKNQQNLTPQGLRHDPGAGSSLLSSLPTYGQLAEGLGGFASLYALNLQGLNQPHLITATDGVGTKVILASEYDHLQGIGHDLVAMCANDLFTVGGRPLGFLDYYATSRLNQDQFQAVLGGVLAALKECDCVLAGGETAQLPGLYHDGHFDLAGFMFGLVDKKNLLGSHLVADQDLLFALPSSGFHANGFSLIREWLDQRYQTGRVPDTLITQLLAPTRLYPEMPYLASTLGSGVIHGSAHITGGGISGNLVRILPKGATAHISQSKIPVPTWMANFIQEHGGEKSPFAFEHVFNLGIGMIVLVASGDKEVFTNAMDQLQLPYSHIGKVTMEKGQHDGEPICQFHE